jgi:hypothetical protein
LERIEKDNEIQDTQDQEEKKKDRRKWLLLLLLLLLYIGSLIYLIWTIRNPSSFQNTDNNGVLEDNIITPSSGYFTDSDDEDEGNDGNAFQAGTQTGIQTGVTTDDADDAVAVGAIGTIGAGNASTGNVSAGGTGGAGGGTTGSGSGSGGGSSSGGNDGTQTPEDVDEVEIKLSNWNDSYNVAFNLQDMLPGDSITKIYAVDVTHRKTVVLHYKANIREGSKKLGEILQCKVVLRNTGEVLYDGNFFGMPESLPYTLDTDHKVTTNVEYEITTYLKTNVDNSYQGLSMTVDFKWWIETL